MSVSNSSDQKWMPVRTKRSKSESYILSNSVSKLNVSDIEKQVIQKIVNNELKKYIENEISYIQASVEISNHTKSKMIKWLVLSKRRLN
jgi:hypothetical protein